MSRSANVPEKKVSFGWALIAAAVLWIPLIVVAATLGALHG
ncbi:MAG TPA: hypothetical protein VJM34_15030 [Novosphingobium sp.]|nr:hypothetical protein [Novosphingobium sp.]